MCIHLKIPHSPPTLTPDTLAQLAVSSFRIIILTFNNHNTEGVSLSHYSTIILLEKNKYRYCTVKSKQLTHGLSNYYHSLTQYRREREKARAFGGRDVASTKLNIFNIWRQLFCSQRGLGPKAHICSCSEPLALTQKLPPRITPRTQSNRSQRDRVRKSKL